jgi:predicted  nucleic acid-binding Zn-ribbon protein
MRIGIALLAAALLAAGCGGRDEKAATQKKIKQLQQEYRKLNGEMAQKLTGWQVIKNKVGPARSAWKAAKGTDDETALKQAYDDATAAANKVIQDEQALHRKILDLKDEITRLGGTP